MANGLLSVSALIFQLFLAGSSNQPHQLVCAECVVEAAALGTALANYDAAYEAYEDAYDAYHDDPNPATAAALGVATANLDAAEDALYDALYDWQMCVNASPEEPQACELTDTLASTVSILER